MVWIRFIIISVALACLTSGRVTYTALAATKIKSIRLFIAAEGFDENDELILAVMSKNDKYEVNDCISTGNNRWTEIAQGPGKGIEPESQVTPQAETEEETESPSIATPSVPTLPKQPSLPIYEVEISAKDGYYFSIMEQKDIQLNGLDGICTKAVRQNNGATLILTIEITGMDKITADIETAEFFAPGTAKWSRAAGAYAYEILLYKNGERKGQMHKTEGTSYDFSPLMREPGSYHYKVYPLSMSGKRGSGVESSACYIRKEDLNSLTKGQRGDGNRYTYSDGLYPQTTWLEIEGTWYFFNEDGYKVTDRWQLWKNNWYYLDKTGKMKE